MGYTNVTITVNDVNDNAPVFSMNRYTLTVIEEQMDAFVGGVSATDSDYSQNGIVRRICITNHLKWKSFEVLTD